MVLGAENRLPAHRPSRRHLIVEAAVRVFARDGFPDTSVQSVADEAQVVPNAIYYHFAGKEELFDAALRHVVEQIDDATESARLKAAAGGTSPFKAVINVLWGWLDGHPFEAQLLENHFPADPRSHALWREFEDRHFQALDGFVANRGSLSGSAPAAAKAAQRFTWRTLMNLLILMRSLRMQGGPLSEYFSRTLRKTVNDIAEALIAPDSAPAQAS